MYLSIKKVHDKVYNIVNNKGGIMKVKHMFTYKLSKEDKKKRKEYDMKLYELRMAEFKNRPCVKCCEE